MNLPGYEFLPAPFWLINAFHISTLTLHFLAMNFVVGGVIIVLWGKFTNRWQDPTVQRFLQLAPAGMAATITFGVAPLIFLQLVYPEQVYSAAIVSGWFWLGVVPAVIIAYYLLYAVSFGIKKPERATRHRWFLMIALAAMLYVSVLYSSVFSLAERPELVKQMYGENQSGWLLNPDISDYLIRWLHMLLGAVTVGGFFIGVIGRDNPPAYKIGKVFYLWGMALASVFGFVYLFTLSDILIPLMRSPAIWALTLAILLSIGSLHFFFKKKFLVAGSMLTTSLLGMVITRHYVRLLKLQPFYDPATVPVETQWPVLALFLVCFVVMAGLLYYMVRMFVRPKQVPTSSE